jgi:hypothetical protein
MHAISPLVCADTRGDASTALDSHKSAAFAAVDGFFATSQQLVVDCGGALMVLLLLCRCLLVVFLDRFLAAAATDVEAVEHIVQIIHLVLFEEALGFGAAFVEADAGKDRRRYDHRVEHHLASLRLRLGGLRRRLRLRLESGLGSVLVGVQEAVGRSDDGYGLLRVDLHGGVWSSGFRLQVRCKFERVCSKQNFVRGRDLQNVNLCLVCQVLWLCIESTTVMSKHHSQSVSDWYAAGC